MRSAVLKRRLNAVGKVYTIPRQRSAGESRRPIIDIYTRLSADNAVDVSLPVTCKTNTSGTRCGLQKPTFSDRQRPALQREREGQSTEMLRRTARHGPDTTKTRLSPCDHQISNRDSGGLHKNVGHRSGVRNWTPERYRRCSSWGCCYHIFNALTLFYLITDHH